MFIDWLSWQTVAIAVVFCTVSVLLYFAFAFVDPYRFRVRARLTQFSDHESVENDGSTEDSAHQEATATILSLLKRVVVLFRFGDQSQAKQRLAMAGIHSTSAHIALINVRIALTIAPMLVFAFVGSTSVLSRNMAMFLGIMAAATGWLIPMFWLNRAIKRYRRMLRLSLPDFLDVMIVCLDAGLSLQDSIRRVTKELRVVHPALSFELGIVQRDIELGSSIDQSLKRFAARTNDDSVRTLSSLIRESQRFGTLISEALRGHAEMLRYQREQTAEENAHKASVKIIMPMMLCIFPATFIVLVSPAAIQIQQAFMKQ
tara:strand:+ start:8577 stop:9524 length:948 start_codon:yes stop_codon:yes gene_type:complete